VAALSVARNKFVLGAALVALFVGVCIVRVLNARREASYQSALRYYCQDIQPGMTRRDVLAHLRAKNATWHSVLLGGHWVDEIDLGSNFWTATWVSVALDYGRPKTLDRHHLVPDDAAVLEKVDLLRITDGP
jgi:hypothetical protein